MPFHLTEFALAFGTLFSSQGARPPGPEDAKVAGRADDHPRSAFVSGRPLGGHLFGCQEEVRHAGTLLPRPIGGLHQE
jgi:hypothetical protein